MVYSRRNIRNIHWKQKVQRNQHHLCKEQNGKEKKVLPKHNLIQIRLRRLSISFTEIQSPENIPLSKEKSE